MTALYLWIAPMSSAISVAVSLSPSIRKEIGIEVLARIMPSPYLADEYQVSRKFVYQ